MTDPRHGQDVRDTKNPCNDAALIPFRTGVPLPSVPEAVARPRS